MLSLIDRINTYTKWQHLINPTTPSKVRDNPLGYQSWYVYYPGGRGGGGGPGGQQGGGGGVGEAPIVHFGTGDLRVERHYHGEAQIKRDDILNWLSPINFFLRQADISRVRQKETGGWLLEHPLFKKWESGSGSTLWCHGIRM